MRRATLPPDIAASAQTTPTAIPTLYRAVQFRSRLEAKWAAFFDNCAWPWVYEPFDLHGYIPDFVLRFPHGPVLVEVKPALYLEDLASHTAKIDASGWTHEAVVVGATLFPALPDWCDYLALGLFKETSPSVFAWAAAMGFRCGKCGALSLFHAEQSWHCRVHGCWDGDGYLGDPAADTFHAYWAAAGNQVQWRP